MANIRILLLLAVGALGAGQAEAAQLGLRGCDTDRIRTDLAASRTPNLIGCKPETVEPILRSYHHGLAIENRVASRTIRSGRIVSQRDNDGLMYVDVSTGPDRSASTERDRTEERRDNQRDQTTETAINILGGVLRAIGEAPQRRPPPPAGTPPPVAPASDQLARVIALPPRVDSPPQVVRPPAPASQPATPPPAPATAPPAPAAAPAVKISQVSRPIPQQSPPTQPEDPPPPPATEAPPVVEPELSPLPDAPPVPAVIAVRPSVFRIAIAGSSSLGEGDELRLIVRREGRDGIGYRLGLTYSNPSLLISPPATLEFGAESPDELIVPVRTAVAEGGGNHDLRVTLASDGQAAVAEPNTVSALILDRTPWWQKLLDVIGSLPVWVAALAAAGAAASAAPFLMPRATCSIGGGSVNLGPTPLKHDWPAMEVDAVIGDASFSLPSPLPIERRIDAEPSPA